MDSTAYHCQRTSSEPLHLITTNCEDRVLPNAGSERSGETDADPAGTARVRVDDQSSTRY